MVEVLQDCHHHVHSPPLSPCHSFKHTRNTHLTLPLPGLINGSMESELCTGNSELTWWWSTGPLVTVSLSP